MNNFNYHIVLNNKHISVGDVFFCFLQAEKYITKQDIISCSLIYVENGFLERFSQNSNEIFAVIQKNRDKIITIDNQQKMYKKLVVELKKRYKIPNKIVAITGTKGKTSTAWYFSQLASCFNGKKCGYIGTLGVYFFQNGNIKSNIKTDNHLTTPTIDMMYRYLNEMVENGIEIVVFEASSHSIVQHRLEGIFVDVACFTNLSQDHLDYHKTMDDYFSAKLGLFKQHLKKNASVIINYDDDYSVKILNEINIRNDLDIQLITSFNEVKKQQEQNQQIIGNTFIIENIRQSRAIQDVDFSYKEKKYNFNTDILGGFQVKNLIMAILSVKAVYRDVEIEKICNFVKNIKAPLGRLQRVEKSNIFIDYAHTPRSLEECILLLKQLYDNIIVVFGCGGDRDRKKRPIMFQITKQLADKIIITNDNPRSEKPINIINDILCFQQDSVENDLVNDEFVVKEIKKIINKYKDAGNNKKQEKDSIIVQEDRKKAISMAVKMYLDGEKENTAVLIAGKGHENYQIIGDNIIHFNDYEEAQNCLAG